MSYALCHMSQCNILDIRIDTHSHDEVLAAIHQFVDSEKPHQIATVNVEFIMEAQRNLEFKKALGEADLCLADGAGVVLAATLTNQPVPPRIPGVDLAGDIVAIAAKEGYSVFLLGGRGGAAAHTAKIWQQLHPELKIVGISEGDPDDPDLIPQIQNSNPQILFVAWGAPKQELWIHEHKHELNVPVMMGVGGTYDFVAGKQKRAPKLMRDVGLEWLWRLVHEPWRWRRQLALPQMFLLILWHKLTAR